MHDLFTQSRRLLIEGDLIGNLEASLATEVETTVPARDGFAALVGRHGQSRNQILEALVRTSAIGGEIELLGTDPPQRDGPVDDSIIGLESSALAFCPIDPIA